MNKHLLGEVGVVTMSWLTQEGLDASKPNLTANPLARLSQHLITSLLFPHLFRNNKHNER